MKKISLLNKNELQVTNEDMLLAKIKFLNYSLGKIQKMQDGLNKI